jgi:hypothetical protein
VRRRVLSLSARVGAVVIASTLVSGCADPPNQPVASVREFDLESGETMPSAAEERDATDDGAAAPASVADVVVRADQPGRPIDRRVFGTNVPAWLGGMRLADPEFRQLAVDAGITVVRMPGGSWSNAYDWRACEESDTDGCVFADSARPSDFASFLHATGLEGMWTVSINETAQSAASLVAFFNGEVDDLRPIGVDRDGTNWGTVATWAQLRAQRGLDDPIGVQLWEVGNEVYGGTPASGGDQCADFGWEDVWTCDGTEYVTGVEGRDGYLAIREAMIAVDPTIEVGAVGVSEPGSWSDWGTEVIEAAGDELDFYVVHEYGFGESPDPEEALDRASDLWDEVLTNVATALPEGVPVAITEYNLVSFGDGDTERSMTRAMNALYTAESLGRMVRAGVPIANHWNLANGVMASGTDYGLVTADTLAPYPAYAAFRLWADTGTEQLDTSGNPPAGVSVYPTRRDDGTLAIVLLNLDDDARSLVLGVEGVETGAAWTAGGWRAESLDDDELVELDPTSLITAGPAGAHTAELPPWSMTLLEVG